MIVASNIEVEMITSKNNNINPSSDASVPGRGTTHIGDGNEGRVKPRSITWVKSKNGTRPRSAQIQIGRHRHKIQKKSIPNRTMVIHPSNPSANSERKLVVSAKFSEQKEVSLTEVQITTYRKLQKAENLSKLLTYENNPDADSIPYYMALDNRLTHYEQRIATGLREGKWSDLCRVREGLLQLAQSKENCVFQRAIDALIQSLTLSKDCDKKSLQESTETKQNLRMLSKELWKRIEAERFPDEDRFEKLIEAYGIVLREFYILFFISSQFILDLPDKTSRGMVVKKSKDIPGDCNNAPSILYYIKFMEEGMKRLQPKQSLNTAKTICDVSTGLTGSVSVGFPVGATVNLKEVQTTLRVAGKGLWKSLKSLWNKISDKEEMWYEHILVLMKAESLFMKTVEEQIYDSEDLSPNDIWEGLEKSKMATSWKWHYIKIQFLKNVIKRTEDDIFRKKAIEEFAECCKKQEIWSSKYRNIQSQLLQTFLELILDDRVAAQVYKACIEKSDVERNKTVEEYDSQDYGRIEFLRYIILHGNNDTLKENAFERLVAYRDYWPKWAAFQLNQEQDYFCRNWYQIIEEFRMNPILKHRKEEFPSIALNPRLKGTKDTEVERRKAMDRFAKNKKEYRIFWNRVWALEEKAIFKSPVSLLPVSSQNSQETLEIENPGNFMKTDSIAINSEENPSFLDIDVSGDGACLFRAISLGLELNVNSEFSSKELRDQAAAHIAENSESHSESIKAQIKVLFNENRQFLKEPNNLFHGIPGVFKAKLINALKKDSEDDYIQSEGVNDYIEHMFDPTAWGGEIELGVLAELLKVELLVYNDPSAIQPLHYVGKDGNQQIHLLHTGGHYKLRIPKGDKVPTSSTPQKPLEICVYDAPVHHFIGREIECETIKEKLPPVTMDNTKTKVVVLTGLEGVGKTQVARKFVAENFANYRMVYTFDGQSTETLLHGYKSLISQWLKVDMTKESPTAVRNRVNVLLEEKNKKGWLLLFDNIDNPKLLHSLCIEQLPKQGGCVLITSRSRFDRTDISIHAFKRNEGEKCVESVTLLKTMTPLDKQVSEEILDELAKELHDIPLALVQAGTLLRNVKSEKYDASTYLASFRNRKYLASFGERYADFTAKIEQLQHETTLEYHNRLTILITHNILSEIQVLSTIFKS